jgi:hypothetical protein
MQVMSSRSGWKSGPNATKGLFGSADSRWEAVRVAQVERGLALALESLRKWLDLGCSFMQV